MITMIARMAVPPENVAAYEKLMAHVTEQTLQNESGVIHYGWARSATEPGVWPRRWTTRPARWSAWTSTWRI